LYFPVPSFLGLSPVEIGFGAMLSLGAGCCLCALIWQRNVNALHSRIKNWFHTFRGVASKNLSAYLAWFRFFDHPAVAGDSRQFLLDAFGLPLAEAI
jgi:hypothetical protein